MDQLVSFDAFLFPADGRAPHLVQLMTSPVTMQASPDDETSRVPHPEVHMDYIAEGIGHRAWRYHVS
jgi:hypothetical protein